MNKKKNMPKKIVLIGPMPKPVNGVSICNELIAEKLENFKVVTINTAVKTFSEDLGKFSFKKLIAGIKPYIYLWKIWGSDIVYMTIGQTFFGVLKYAPFFIFSKLLRKQIIVHIHGNYLGKQFSELAGWRKSIFKNILKMSDKGIVLSDNLRKNLTPFIDNSRIYVLHNFVEEVLYNVSEKDIINKKTDKLRIVFLSNLMTEKGITDLLKALLILKEKNIEFEAKLAGNIDLSIKKQVLNLIEQNPDVQYVGVVRGEAKKNLLLNANTFVFPTYYTMEGQPIAILEALVTGNIVLTTKHAGIPDIFSEENGIYIKKKSPEDIAGKLIYLNNNLDAYKPMMINNHLEAKRKYGEKKFLNNLAKIFNA